MRYDYFSIYILLRSEEWLVNPKRVYRLYRGDGLPSAQASSPEHQRYEPQATARGVGRQREAVDGLRLGRAVRLPAAASADGHRCVYARGSGDRRRPRYPGRADDRGNDTDFLDPRHAQDHPRGQRAEVHFKAFDRWLTRTASCWISADRSNQPRCTNPPQIINFPFNITDCHQ